VSTPQLPPVATSLEQQRTLARDLIRAARAGDAGARDRLRAVRADAGDPSRGLKLADAQLAVAREAGFASWPTLVAALRERDVAAFREAVGGNDVARTRKLLALPHVRAHVNDPMFAFGQRAAHIAAKHEAMLAVLLDAGADVTLKSEWVNGPYTVLDNADEATARFLMARGAPLTPNVAARLGWLDELRAMVAADPALVYARGGDGQQPLHEARTAAIADFLLDHGADVDARCIDHKSTPAQYALADRPDVCRRLLARGATPDIFIAARLGDSALAQRLIETDPACLAARVNAGGYPPVPPFNIYCWTLGFGVSPHDVAARFGHRELQALLTASSPLPTRFINAVLSADSAAARALVADHPALPASLPREAHGHLAQAIFHERFDAAALMLDFGFDPAAPGVDGGSALHAACWVGQVPLVERILSLDRIPIDTRDPTHGSTPLGWAAFGAVHRQARGADYPAVAAALVAAGADLTAPGNRAGRSLIEMAHGNPAMQEALRRLGAA
jgi:ankyrin repeat protein